MLREARERKGFTQRELADKVGCSLKSISRWEKHQCTISSDYCRKLAYILDIDLGELIDEVSGGRVNEKF